MKRILAGLFALLMSTQVAFAAIATLPVVKNSGGAYVQTTGVICVDLTGTYVGCGASGGSGAGAQSVQGSSASGGALAGSPFVGAGLIGGTGNVTPFNVDNLGRQQTLSQGVDAANATGTSNPVRVAGSSSPTANSGTVINLTLDGAGVLRAPIAGTGNRVITKTSVSATTSTTICPTATAPVVTEIWFQTGSLGISLNGGTLTQATWGATLNTNPDIVINTPGTLYTLPVAPTNIVTAYTGTAQGVTCIQTIRQ